MEGEDSGYALTVPVDQLAADQQKLEETVQSYVSLVPDHLNSCRSVTADSGLEEYLEEAYKQVRLCTWFFLYTVFQDLLYHTCT